MPAVIHFYAKNGLFYTEIFHSPSELRRRLARLKDRVRIVHDEDEYG